MSFIANQIVAMYALLINFQPVFIPVSTIEQSDVAEYPDCCYESDSDKSDSR